MDINNLVKETDRRALIGAIAFVIVLIMSGQPLYKSVTDIVVRQQTITDNLRRWVASYKALQPIETEWREKLKSSTALDLLALYNAINPEAAGLSSDADTMLVEKIDRVASNGVEPGASLVYVISAGKPGFVVTAATWHDLINGVEKMAYRQDIRLQAITMEATRDDDAPTAIIHGLAIVLRDEEAAKK